MRPGDPDIVFQSYGRCCNRDTFFVDFYDCFMAKSEAIRQVFKKTDMSNQRHLLRNGIMQLVLHARGLPDTKLKALGESHSRRGYNIQPHHYSDWLDALLQTLEKHDPYFCPDTHAAWIRAITPGIEKIKNAY